MIHFTNIVTHFIRFKLYFIENWQLLFRVSWTNQDDIAQYLGQHQCSAGIN